jgi:hypothetical protein
MNVANVNISGSLGYRILAAFENADLSVNDFELLLADGALGKACDWLQGQALIQKGKSLMAHRQNGESYEVRIGQLFGKALEDVNHSYLQEGFVPALVLDLIFLYGSHPEMIESRIYSPLPRKNLLGKFRFDGIDSQGGHINCTDAILRDDKSHFLWVRKNQYLLPDTERVLMISPPATELPA